MQRSSAFRVLYRDFLFRIVDLELLSTHAEGDSRTLLGQLAALLIFGSLILAVMAWIWASMAKGAPPLAHLIGAWTMQHFLVATTMLVLGLFALLTWESLFPDRRDTLVLGPLPIPAKTIFLAKLAAVATALGLTLGALHGLAGFAWPTAFALLDSAPVPSLLYDRAVPPVLAADFPAVMDHDIAPMLRHLNLAALDGGAGIVVGVCEHGRKSITAYGAAKPDSIFEIGSISKTFTGLLLARMAAEGTLDLRDPVRGLLPANIAPRGPGFEINLLDLATHHSGLPRMPDNTGPESERESFVNYHAPDLYDFVRRHGLNKPPDPHFAYSNLGYALLGVALANRAHTTYPELLAQQITRPLGLKDTVIELSAEQRARFLQGYGYHGRPAPPWNLDAFAGAGGIRSTAGDMLTYLEAQLHPQGSPLARALLESQKLRAYVSGEVRSALAWQYDPAIAAYVHDGATGGFTSFAFFDPRRDIAGVVLVNSHSIAYPFSEILGAHTLQRLAGEPAFSLTPVSVPAAGPVRSFLAYWLTMVAAGVFIFSAVLSLQGFAAWWLPRRWFLRASSLLQLVLFGAFVTAYFLQRSPALVLVEGSAGNWSSWIPSYWFAGLYQQLSGSLHPALAPFARRAWIGLAGALGTTVIAYAACYRRTLRRIIEEPDLAPAVRQPFEARYHGSFEHGIAQFSVRSLLRSRQHRMIFAFYLGIGFAFAMLFLNAPRELSGPTTGGAWDPLSIPLLASSILVMGCWVVGARIVFALPLELPANWIFRVMPFAAGQRCLAARRRAIFMVAFAPAWTITAAVLFPCWPWRLAVAHLAALAFLGIFLSEFSFDSAQKIPFACSYLPGKSNLHLTFWLWAFLLLVGVVMAAINEHDALQNPAATVALLAALALAALFAILRNNRMAAPDRAELRFDEIPPGKLQDLHLS